MSWRVAGWSTGFILGVALAAAIPETVFPGVRLVALGATLVTLGLAGQVLERLGTRSGGALAAAPLDLRPADGQVEIVPSRDLNRRPNAHDARFGRFVSLAGAPARSSRVAARAEAPGRRDCPPLIGRVVLVSVYLDCDGGSWDEDELAASQAAVLRAGRWLEREALRWGAPVNVGVSDTYVVARVDGTTRGDRAVGFDRVGDEVVAYEEEEETHLFAAVTQAAVANGFRDAPEMFDALGARVGGDVPVWLVHPLRCGVSRAYPPDREGALLPGTSLAVCYVRETPFTEPLKGPAVTDPVTVVHETLHLFGATDKYGYALRSFEPGSVTGQEVMRLSVTRLEPLRVDPLTALELGWTDRLMPAPKTPTTAGNPRGSRRSSG